MGQHHPVVKLGQLCSIKTGKLDANAMTDNGEFPFFTCAREDYRTDTYAFEGDSLLISGNGDIGIVKRYNGKFNAYQRMEKPCVRDPRSPSAVDPRKQV